jgi:hypothetical protein
MSQASSILQSFLEISEQRDVSPDPTTHGRTACSLSRALTALVLTGLSLAAPFEDIYFGLWGFNSSLACIAIGGMFMALTWQTHLLALACGEYPRDGVEEGCL